jgi:hypothetical protein
MIGPFIRAFFSTLLVTGAVVFMGFCFLVMLATSGPDLFGPRLAERLGAGLVYFYRYLPVLQMVWVAPPFIQSLRANQHTAALGIAMAALLVWWVWLHAGAAHPAVR